MLYTLEFDGACRGNPGLCGAGYVIYKDDEILERHSKFVSKKNTNNYSEYSALLFGIERLVELGAKDIKVQGDSQLAINQLNGVYRVKSENILSLYNKIIENLINFDVYTFCHIKREKNKLADQLANIAIDNYIEQNEKKVLDT